MKLLYSVVERMLEEVNVMENIVLRDYQRKFVDDILSAFNKHKRIIGVAPCGSGKTIMATKIVEQFANANKKVLFFVHVHELVEQTSRTFNKYGIDHSIIEAGKAFNPAQPIQVASIQTLSRRLSKIQVPDLLICDECHHVLANTYINTLKKFSNAQLLGLTATPERYGGIRLGDVFTSMVCGPSVSELISLGHLSKYEYYAPTKEDIDLSKVKTVAGEYETAELEHLMINPRIIGGILEHYNKLVPNKPTLMYCVNRRHSEFMANWFRENDVCAVHLDCKTPADERNQIVKDFRKGYIKVLCNVNIFGEGFDSPSMEAVILARPTRSLTKYIQQSMRALRINPNNPDKVATILDHVGNYTRFGLPSTDHIWSLDPNEEQEPPVKKCPRCGVVVPLNVVTCPVCGLVFEKPAEEEPTPINVEKLEEGEGTSNLLSAEGQLKLISEDSIESTENNSNINFNAPRGIKELLVVAEKRGYTTSWAAINALVDARSLEDCKVIAEACKYKTGWAFYKWRALEQLLDQNKDPRLYKKSLLNA